ncbi:MAG TPA: AsmA family protein [Candidatus Omnitrophota bacterium]|nr:AsmA family protein [Candidatus Omnitrophota bacterium]
MKKFLKILKVLLIGFMIVLVIVITGGYFFLKNLDIKQYKTPIIHAAEQALGRTVNFQDIQLSVSVMEGVRFYLSDFTVADNPAFSSDPFFSTHQIEAGIDVLSFIKTRQISVPSILISAPRINLIRNAEGVLNVQTLGAQSGQPSAPAPSGQKTMALPALLIQALKIKNAEIRVIDLSAHPPAEISVTKMDFSINNFSLTQPFEMLLEAAVLSAQKNLRVTSNAQIHLRDQSAALSNLDMTLDLGALALDELRRFPMLTGAPLPTVLKGQVRTAVKELTISDKGLENILINASLSDGACVLPDVVPGLPIEADKINLKITDFSLGGNAPFHITLNAALLNTAPNIHFTGDASLDLVRQAVTITNGTADVDLRQLPLEKIRAAGLIPAGTPFPETLAGDIRLELKKIEISAKGVGQLLADMSLKDGAVFIPVVAPGISLNAPKINLEAQNISLQDPFLLRGSLAYESDVPNISFQSTVAVDPAQQSVHLTAGTVSTDLAQWSMERLKNALVPLKDASLPETLQGTLTLSLSELTAGAQGLVSLDGKGAIKDGIVKMKELAVPLEKINTSFHVTASDVTIDTLTASLGAGRITAQFTMKDYLASQTFETQAKIQGLNLAEVLDQQKAPVKAAGLVSGTFQARGSVMDMNSITGDGILDVQEAKLVDLNVLKTVLNGMVFLPNASARLETGLPERYKAKLQDKDTDIRKISFTGTIADGKILIEPAAIEADEFLFSGTSQAGFDQKYIMDGSFKIPEELSAAIVNIIEEMKYLFGQDNAITLPIHVQGEGNKPPTIHVLKTAEDLFKNALRNQGKEALGNVLKKVIGGDSSSPEEQTGTGQPETGQTETPSMEEQIIEKGIGILNQIFK